MGGRGQRGQALDEHIARELRPNEGINTRPIGRRNSRRKRLTPSLRENAGILTPDGLGVDCRITLGENAMTVVDPDPDRGTRPGACDHQIQLAVAVHIAGENVESTLSRRNVEGSGLVTRAQLKLDSIRKAFSVPAIRPDDGEVRTTVTV